MKRITSVFLLFTVGLSIVGFFPVFRILQYRIRYEVKERIIEGAPNETLHKVSFNETEKIDWVEEGREFRLHNKMFDIVRQEKINGKIIYWCINDEEENQLFTNLDNLVKKQTEHEGSPLTKILAKFLLQVYLSEKSCIIILNPNTSDIRFDYKNKSAPIYICIEAPPPKIV